MSEIEERQQSLASLEAMINNLSKQTLPITDAEKRQVECKTLVLIDGLMQSLLDEIRELHLRKLEIKYGLRINQTVISISETYKKVKGVVKVKESSKLLVEGDFSLPTLAVFPFKKGGETKGLSKKSIGIDLGWVPYQDKI